MLSKHIQTQINKKEPKPENQTTKTTHLTYCNQNVIIHKLLLKQINKNPTNRTKNGTRKACTNHHFNNFVKSQHKKKIILIKFAKFVSAKCSGKCSGKCPGKCPTKMLRQKALHFLPKRYSQPCDLPSFFAPRPQNFDPIFRPNRPKRPYQNAPKSQKNAQKQFTNPQPPNQKPMN